MDVLLIPAFIFFAVLVPIVGAALLLYGVPVRIAARLVRDETVQAFTIMVSWAGLGIRTSGTGTSRVTEVLIGQFPVLSSTGSPGSSAGERARQPSAETVPDLTAAAGDVPTPTEASSDDARTPRHSLRSGTMITTILQRAGPVASFGSAFMKAGRFVDARGKVILGLGDPVLTGEVCGMYWASRFVMQASGVYVDLEPVFDREVLSLDVTVRFKVNHPLLVLIAAVGLLRPPCARSAADSLPRRHAEGAAS
jgi:hypothetical protein